MRYLLRHLRHGAARRAIIESLLNRLRNLLPASYKTGKEDPRRFLRAGDILLDAAGGELFWLETVLPCLPQQTLPAIACRADIRQTNQLGYHPLEIVWILEQAGYQVRVLGESGPGPRREAWCDPRPKGVPGPWLLALPAGRADEGATG